MAQPPFNLSFQLDDSPIQGNLPGFPNISLQNLPTLLEFLEKEILVTELDNLTTHMSNTANASTTISPLHYHRFKAREIYAIEDPGLHLTIMAERLFIKPIPRYLLSHAFWSTYLLAQPSPLVRNSDALRRTALGFLRTYFYLIRYESDLRLAKSNGLVPETTIWASWCAFCANLPNIADSDVSPRYLHGEFHLPHLNWLAKIYLHRFRYRESHGRLGGNLRRFYEPLLFLFGVLSLILSAMQVGLAALPDPKTSMSWLDFVKTCRWIAVVSILLMACLLLVLPVQHGLVWLSKGVSVVGRIFGPTSYGTATEVNQAQRHKLHV